MKAASRVVMYWMMGAFGGGCAYSPAELMQKELVVEYFSAKQPRVVAGCIGTHWLAYYSGVSTVVTDTGYMVTRGDVSNIANGAVSIEPEGTGSRVKYAERLYWDPEDMAQGVRDCR